MQQIKYFKLLLLTIVLPIYLFAQNDRKEAAASALNTFKKLVPLMQSKTSTITAKDTGNLELGDPLPMAFVPLNMLKEYREGRAAAPLIRDMESFIYPVLGAKSQHVLGNIILSHANGKWAGSTFETEVRIFTDSVKYYITDHPANYKLVSIIAFHTYFLCYTRGDALFFIPLRNDEQRKLFSGQPINAEKVLSSFVNTARNYNGKPL